MHDNEFVRKISIVKVWVGARILNVEYTLAVSTEQRPGVDQHVRLGSPPTRKMMQGQSIMETAELCLFEKFGMHDDFRKNNIVFIEEEHPHVSEEVEFSKKYPGLKTVYTITAIRCRVVDPFAHDVQAYGLPECTCFDCP